LTTSDFTSAFFDKIILVPSLVPQQKVALTANYQ
jgi:hypothetical protein